MKCSCGYLAKGDICDLCGKLLRDGKDKAPSVKKVSDKMLKILPEYIKKKKAFLKKFPMCAVYPNRKAKDIHHRKGKIGDLYLNELYWLGVSREGHIWIHTHESEAKKLGFLEESRLAKEEK